MLAKHSSEVTFSQFLSKGPVARQRYVLSFLGLICVRVVHIYTYIYIYIFIYIALEFKDTSVYIYHTSKGYWMLTDKHAH